MKDQCKKCGSQLLCIEQDGHELCRNCLPRGVTRIYPKFEDIQEIIPPVADDLTKKRIQKDIKWAKMISGINEELLGKL